MRKAQRALAATSGEVGVDHGVLDVAVPEPVLDEAQIAASLQQVGGDGVTEAVEVALGRRLCSGTVAGPRSASGFHMIE